MRLPLQCTRLRPVTVDCARIAFVAAVACGLITGSAAAETALTVDLSTTLGPVTHVASGSLYGVTETLPADVNGLIAPLKPRMFTNPAANQQQPVGDAIVVAGRVAPTGALVTIRLADWLKGFYTFTSMTDWFDKIGQTVSRRKAANLSNIYAYEIWNEPSGTYASSNPLSFNEFWRQTFAKLRELDPGIKITGPSLSYYNESFLRDFLSFCKTNNCLPDIVGWHELGGGNFTATFQAYRALEKSLGIGPLPISLNEYSGAARIDVEGQPGASAPLIAKFERFRVDSACISYWDVAHAGRLGSLLATNTEPNGGWWFYKWYGDMSGNMVSTTPPTPSSATALDGFANLDAASKSASVLFGGVNDGTIRVTVKGFATASVFGSQVHAVVERTPFVNRTTVVKSTSTVSTADLAIAADQISVAVTGTNATDGYRLRLTPVGASSGGTAAVGGATSVAGRSTGGTTTGGNSTGGLASGGNYSQTGGVNAGGRTSGGGSSLAGRTTTGGAPTLGGATSAGGTSTAGGAIAAGGAATSGGTVTGGAPVAVSSGGLSGSGGVGSTAAGGVTEPGNGGGSTGVGGTSTATGSTEGSLSPQQDAGGCSCMVAGSNIHGRHAAGLTLLALAAGALRRRKRPQRR